MINPEQAASSKTDKALRLTLTVLDYLIQLALLLGLSEQIFSIEESDRLTTIVCTTALLYFIARELLTSQRKWNVAGLLLACLALKFNEFWWLGHSILLLLVMCERRRAVAACTLALLMAFFGMLADWARDDYFKLGGELPLALQYWHVIAIILALIIVPKKWRSLALLLGIAVIALLSSALQSGVSFAGLSTATPLLLIFLSKGLEKDKIIIWTGIPLTTLAILVIGLFGGLHQRCSTDLALPNVTPDFVKYLLIAEDPRFFWHQGVDFHRLRMAVQESYATGQAGRGGSTITMQTAKICFLSFEKTPSRKLLQILLAWFIELNWSKSEILAIYLNNLEPLPGIKGLTASSKHFYGLEPEQLSADQSLNLVLSIFNPAEFNPSLTPSAAVNLRKAVIKGRVRKYTPLLDVEITKLKPGS